MALDDDDDIDSSDDESNDSGGATDLTNLPTAGDKPAFAKDIVIPKKKKQTLQDIPLDMSVQYTPQNPYLMDGHSIGTHSSENLQGEADKPGFMDTAKAEAYNWSSESQLVHAGITALNKPDPAQDIASEGWTPKSNVENFINVRPENLGFLLDATGPKDQTYRLHQIYAQQAHDDALTNGSFVAKLLGGFAGAVTDLPSYIPIIGAYKYAKLSSTFISGALRSIPGVAAYSLINEGAKNVDRVNGNMTDFLTQSFTDTLFGSLLFGAGGALGTGAEIMGTWQARNVAKNYMDGIDVKLLTDESGKINGYKAVDTTGSLSADKVSFAQDLVDSTFLKSGLFKVPYLGSLISKSLALKIPYTNAYFGSQLQSLLQSPYKVMRGFVDRVADHSIYTEGLAKGEAAPKKFASLMQQSMAQFRSLSDQVRALHLQMNGFDIRNRPLGGAINTGLNLKQKAANILDKDLGKSAYVSRDDFDSQVSDVLLNETQSDHAPVNAAANLLRPYMDNIYKNWRTAYNLPEDWLPTKTAAGYLTRVYDTAYMNTNKNQWTSVISNWLRDADNTIANREQPIKDLADSIKEFEGKHTEAVAMLAAYKKGQPRPKRKVEPNTTETGIEVPGGTTDLPVGSPAHTLHSMRRKLRAMKDQLQDELRTNPDLQLHVHDWNALSATEGKTLASLLKPQRQLAKKVKEQKAKLAAVKAEASRALSAAKNTEDIKKAIPKAKKHAQVDKTVKAEEDKLHEAQAKLDTETDRLQDMAHKGEINPRFYNRSPDSFHYEFKNPNDRLKFREKYERHDERESHAKAYYDTILGQTAEQTINDIMEKFTGRNSSNPVKARTLLVPDKLLYDNKFMTKDLMAKVGNYGSYLNRRIHLKSVFNDVTVDGNISSLFSQLHDEFQKFRTPLDNKKSQLQEKLNAEGLTEKEQRDIRKQINKNDKELTKVAKDFDNQKEIMQHLFNKMMGKKDFKFGNERARSILMSLTAIANLPFVPFTQLNDLSAIGLQHGMWPFIRDGLEPIITSLGGMLKSKNSEAFRKTAPSLHLAAQDVLNGYQDRNWGMHTNPYLNLGRIATSLETLAHISSNFTGTNYIDNGLQRFSGAVAQSEFMRILTANAKGKISKRDSLYIRKYGIDPDKWGERMIAAFQKDGGGKTRLGGYQSLFHQWSDMEAANEFSSAVFRAIKDTNIQSGIADSPFWTDSLVGSIIKGFNGWMYASVNRYVIPSMQQPDASKLLGVMFMLGMGSLVDPLRRFARGDEPWPPTLTDKQKLWAAVNNSGYFSWYATMLSDANLLSGDRLMGDLKSDKYKDRSRVGLLGPAFGTVNNMADVLGMIATGEWNEGDVKKAVRMTPFANASWTYWMSHKLIDSLNLPKNRNQAHALKENSQ